MIATSQFLGHFLLIIQQLRKRTLTDWPTFEHGTFCTRTVLLNIYYIPRFVACYQR